MIKCDGFFYHTKYKYIFPTDINECDTGYNNICNESANCTDTDGSYYCTCLTGYSGDGINCDSKLS